ncbi:MAG: hypothetical protein Q7Q73_12865 [Verrucomicrobiota bacterium JB024]|nr:hypothetical protein [Verrucomicrobiota bacterium JB024]
MKTLTTLALLLGALAAQPLCGGSAGADPAAAHAWGENTGWVNALPHEEHGLQSTWTCLSGYLWSGSLGWIYCGDGSPASGEHYSQTTGDTGVNRDPDSGLLFGYAWSENAGWIRFAASATGSQYDPVLDEDGAFSGYAWGENIGWIALSTLRSLPDYDGDGVDNAADPDKDGDGIPNAFENDLGLNPRLALDAARDQDGDRRSAYAEYLAGTDPRDGTSVFRIERILEIPDNGQLLIRWTGATQKSYRVVGAISPEGPFNIPLTDTALLTDLDFARATITPGEARFFRVELVPEP